MTCGGQFWSRSGGVQFRWRETEAYTKIIWIIKQKNPYIAQLLSDHMMLSICQINKNTNIKKKKKNVNLKKRLYYRGPAPTIEPSQTTRAAARWLYVCVCVCVCLTNTCRGLDPGS